jgi:hypothetical protein
MDLANMRANGMRSLAASCPNCRRGSVLNVDAYPDHVLMPVVHPAHALHPLRHDRRRREGGRSARAGNC